ncbi:MAG TPA: hypothetical protein VOB72_15885 [Candidatus Dormibacteraeota bacterium]|nr:hypothetical protein [Candidatus Dormibacteraeota bacterium]
MNRSFIAREWGAVTFVLTVLLGIIIVPIALVLGNKPPPPPALPNATPTPTVSAPASPAPTVSPTPTP